MSRATTTAGVILGVVSVVAVLAAAQPAQGPPTVPRTPWGAPDLQGIWDYATLTPLQRPSAFAGREFLTDEEAAAFEQTSAEGWEGVRRRNRGISNDFWFDRATEVSEDKRTSLIVDPPDGRIPPLTPDATARDARTEDRPLKQRMSLAEGADGPEDRGLFERCILGPNSGPPMVPFMYTNLVQFFQTPGYVVILNEMIHDARIVPLEGRAHVHPGIAQWMGDSRGHWEDETLVVETTNFEDKASFRGNVMRRGASGETLHLVERFTRQPQPARRDRRQLSPWRHTHACRPPHGDATPRPRRCGYHGAPGRGVRAKERKKSELRAGLVHAVSGLRDRCRVRASPRRTDQRAAAANLAYRWWPETWLVNWGPQLNYSRNYDFDGVLNDENARVGVNFQFAQNTGFTASVSRDMERFGGFDFFKTRYRLNTTVSARLLGIGFGLNGGDQIFFDPDAPYLGYETGIFAVLGLRPVSRFRSEINFNTSRFTDPRNDDARVFDVKIVRALTTYQFTDRLLLRNIAEYNSFDETVGLNFLVTYRINAGTVFYVGYDDRYQQGDLIDEEFFPTTQLQRTNRAIFTKLQYLFRL